MFRCRWEMAGAHDVDRPDQGPLTLALEARLAMRGAHLTASLDAPYLFGGETLSGEGELRAGQRLRYLLRFERGGGGWTVDATQRLSLWGSPAPFTLVEGELRAVDGGATHPLRLRFDPRTDLPAMLRSLRPDR